MPGAAPAVTVLIPCRNEAGFIEACLRSVLENDYPAEQLEILVLDGMSDDGTRERVARLAQAHPHIRLVDNPRRSTPAALNQGVREARGRIVIRLDAHATYAPDYLRRSVETLERTGVENVGGIMHTIPRGDGLVGRAISAALSHPFGVGDSHFRVHPKQPRQVDTVFGGCYRREVFDRVGPFNERLLRGQDLEFNLRLKRAGGRTLLDPAIQSYYYARSDLPGFIRHNFSNGEWVVLPFAYSPIMPVGWKHLAPLGFVVALMVLVAAGLLGVDGAWTVLAAAAGAYLAGAIAAAVHVAWRERDARLAPLMPVVFAALHVPYGVGSLWGVARAVRAFARSSR